MLQKLLKARAAGGVVIANPTTIKSFALKFVETINAIIETRSALSDHAENGTGTTRSFSLLALIGRAKGRAVVSLCGCVVVSLCRCVVVWLCGCVVVWLCGCVVVWL